MSNFKDDLGQLLLKAWLAFAVGGSLLLLFATSFAIELVDMATPFFLIILGLCLVATVTALGMLLFQNVRLMAANIFTIVANVVFVLLWLTSLSALFAMTGRGLTILGFIVGPLAIAMAAIVALIRGQEAILLGLILLAIFLGVAIAASYWAESLYAQWFDKDR